LHAKFEQLPSGAQTAIYGFLSVEPASYRRASAEEIAFYRDDPDSAPLIAEWAHRAPDQLGVVLGRARMMLGRMSAADREKTNNWVASLSPSQYRAVAKALAR
jgi:hypothetical protein